MSRAIFFRECFERAVSGGFRWAEIISFVLTIVGGLVAWEWPQLNKALSMMIWMLPLIVFFGTFLVAWTLAPYVMYRELENKSAKSIESLNKELDSLRSGVSLGDIKERLYIFRNSLRDVAKRKNLAGSRGFADKVLVFFKKRLRQPQIDSLEQIITNILNMPFGTNNEAGQAESLATKCAEHVERVAANLTEHDVKDWSGAI